MLASAGRYHRLSCLERGCRMHLPPPRASWPLGMPMRPVRCAPTPIYRNPIGIKAVRSRSKPGLALNGIGHGLRLPLQPLSSAHAAEACACRAGHPSPANNAAACRRLIARAPDARFSRRLPASPLWPSCWGIRVAGWFGKKNRTSTPRWRPAAAGFRRTFDRPSADPTLPARGRQRVHPGINAGGGGACRSFNASGDRRHLRPGSAGARDMSGAPVVNRAQILEAPTTSTTWARLSWCASPTSTAAAACPPGRPARPAADRRKPGCGVVAAGLN